MKNETLKIGVFDSGLGGLTVVKALSQVIQNTHIFYIADTKNAPYGEKTPEQILQFSLDITHYFIQIHQIDVLVLACNTATSFAISYLRQKYPHLIIVGTEPGVKPAIEKTQTNNIGIMATPATLKGQKYQNLIRNLAKEHEVNFIEQACPGLVEQIEKGHISTLETKILLKQWLEPMKEKRVDTIVLGCTHYPLVSSEIKKIMSDTVFLVETGQAIAKHLLFLAKQNGHKNRGDIQVEVFSTGEIHHHLASEILNKNITIKKLTISYS